MASASRFRKWRAFSLRFSGIGVALAAFFGSGCDGVLDIQNLAYDPSPSTDGGAHPHDASKADAPGTSRDAPAAKGDAPTLGCGLGTSLCGNECVDEQSDPTHCGACGEQCGSTLVCSRGSCAASCAADLTECRLTQDGGSLELCVDTQHDPANCGTCNQACPSGHVCNAGRCDVSCPGGEVNCGGTCVDPTTSNLHCGATAGCGTNGGSSGADCKSGQLCSGGKCGASCLAGELDCEGTCVNPLTSGQFCGATGDCKGTKVGTTCSAGHVCAGGTCAVSCLSGEIDCNGTCVDPNSSPQYCGASGNCKGSTAGAVCTDGQVCAGGACAVSCPDDELNCGGTCTNPETSNQFCGASGACTGATAGKICAGGQVCVNGACGATCGGDNIACGGACVDPQSNNQYCGATGACTGAAAGTTCPLQSACVEGTCSPLAVSCTGATPSAPTFASIWPESTGWLDANGSPISLTLHSQGANVTYECRTGPAATIDSINFTECDAGDGTGLGYAPAPDANGAHETDVRVRTSETCVSATTAYEFYVHSSLNSVPNCAAAATDDQIFTAAGQYLTTSATFGGSTQLANPFIELALTSRTASVLSLRHTFTMNPPGTLISMRRTRQSARSGTCANMFRMGYTQLGTRTYTNCAAVVFNAEGNGVCLSSSLSSLGMFTSVNQRLAGPAPRASFYSDRPFSQKSRSITNDAHWIYLPD